ncbi:MAG TPA: NAD-dependent epimerase/dehydratase family protein [Candidatus Xenobia bacterium]|jgi:UDP-glucose 4-epimerase
MAGVRRVVITGGAGFIGSHLAEHFCALGVEVTVLDSLRSGYRHNLNGLKVDLVEGSVTDAGLVSSVLAGADLVFHLAAMVSVPESLEKPGECVDINVHGTLNVLNAARLHQVRKVVLSSTCAVYGNDPAGPKNEAMRPAPISPYGITKLDGEYYLDLYRAHWGLGTASLRYFNVFGPRQDPKSQYAAVVPIFISRAAKNEDLYIHGDGEQTRDFIFVKDVVTANVQAASHAGTEGIYNVGRGHRVTINDLARKIVDLVGSRSRIKHVPGRAGEIRHSTADISRLTSTGWAPQTDLEAGLRQTVDFFTSRLAV